MKWIYVPVGIVLLTVYTALNYYMGKRGAQAFGVFLGEKGLILWWTIFWIMAFLYMVMRFLQPWMPASLARWFIHIGAYWMVVMVYGLLALLFIDVIRVLLWMGGANTAQWPWLKTLAGIAVLVMVAATMVYGTWNARHPRVVSYDVYLNADNKTTTERTIPVAVVSDIHLGTIVGKQRLQQLVDGLQELDPELILFVGDIIDENVNHFIDDKMDSIFRQLNPALGMYAVLGNHEYFGGHLEDIVTHLERSHVRILRDEGVMVEDLFYLAGREDLVAERMQGTARKPLEEILENIDPVMTPVVLMDHQPKEWAEARDMGVRLQLSGHTHKGQLFPFGMITERLFPEDWGKLEEKGSVLIVSSGYGTWGPPVRTGNRPEIVMVYLKQ